MTDRSKSVRVVVDVTFNHPLTPTEAQRALQSVLDNVDRDAAPIYRDGDLYLESTVVQTWKPS